MFRSIRLFRLFLAEQTDPESFYAALARDAISQVEEHASLAGRTALDIGGGPGYLTEAVRARGGHCYLFEPDLGELRRAPAAVGVGAGPPGSLEQPEPNPAGPVVPAVQADGYWLPAGDGSVDVTLCSNVLEHVPDPHGLIDELVRVTAPGGLIYLSFTNWLSPWGGHEMSPWHYLGPRAAQRRYVRRHGHLPKNRPGATLFLVHIGPVLAHVRARADVEVLVARPRYYPRWCQLLVRLPGVREVATWNLLLILRRAR
jgi:SAM-dependent methyltransferase